MGIAFYWFDFIRQGLDDVAASMTPTHVSLCAVERQVETMLRGCAVKGTGEALMQKGLASPILKAFKAFVQAVGAVAKRNNGLEHYLLAIDYAELAVDIADLLQPTSLTMARLTKVLQQFIPEFPEETTDAPFSVDNSEIVSFKLLAGTSGRLFV